MQHDPIVQQFLVQSPLKTREFTGECIFEIPPNPTSLLTNVMSNSDRQLFQQELRVIVNVKFVIHQIIQPHG